MLHFKRRGWRNRRLWLPLGAFLRHALLTLALLWSVLVLSGGQIDKVCLEGRLSAAQALAINTLPWSKCPSYRLGNCRAEEGDRIVIRECSELSRWFFRRD